MRAWCFGAALRLTGLWISVVWVNKYFLNWCSNSGKTNHACVPWVCSNQNCMINFGMNMTARSLQILQQRPFEYSKLRVVIKLFKTAPSQFEALHRVIFDRNPFYVSAAKIFRIDTKFWKFVFTTRLPRTESVIALRLVRSPPKKWRGGRQIDIYFAYPPGELIKRKKVSRDSRGGWNSPSSLADIPAVPEYKSHVLRSPLFQGLIKKRTSFGIRSSKKALSITRHFCTLDACFI